MSGALGTVLAVGSLWLTGLALARYLLPATAGRSERQGLALLCGVGGMAWLLFLWSLAGGALTPTLLRTGGSLGAIAGLWTWWRGRNHTAAERDAGSVFQRLAATVVIGLWLVLLVQTLLTPQRLWDERAIFGIKAAVLHLDESIHSETLRHPRFVQYHPRYPLLLPLAEAYVYGWIGGIDDRWAKVIPPLVALGLWLTFAGVLSRALGRDQGWLFALLLATVPALTTWEYGFLTAQADAVVAGFHGAAMLYLWSGLQRVRATGSPVAARGEATIAGLLAACTLFTKDEGLAFVLVDTTLCSLLLVVMSLRPTGGAAGRASSAQRPGRHCIDRVLAAGAPLGAFLTPVLGLGGLWFWHRNTLPTTTEMTYFDRLSWDGLLAGAATLGWSLPHLFHRMFREWITWGLAWWGLIAGAVLRPRAALRAEQLLVLGDIVGALAALLVAGMLAPTPVEEHLGGSAHRFLLQITPCAVLFLAGQLTAEDESRTANP